MREQGIAGVRADAVARRLDLTKGSFNHHFSGVADYRRALLDRYERTLTDAVEQVRDQVTGMPAGRAIAELPAHWGALDLQLDTAVRGWAFQDREARAAVERVDAARLGLLIDLWAAKLGDRDAARAAALVPHLIAIGASVAQPAPSSADLGAVFDLLARIAPAVPGG